MYLPHMENGEPSKLPQAEFNFGRQSNNIEIEFLDLVFLQSRDIRSKNNQSCRLQRQGVVSALSLCISRTLQPYGLRAYKAFKALVLALAALFFIEQNGKAREIDRIPPRGGILSVSRLDLNFRLRLPRLPKFSQKLLLLVIWRAKSYFCPFRTFSRKGRKLNFDRKQPRSPYKWSQSLATGKGETRLFCLVFQEFYAVNHAFQSTF